jgi:hypothetical protein
MTSSDTQISRLLADLVKCRIFENPCLAFYSRLCVAALPPAIAHFHNGSFLVHKDEVGLGLILLCL